MISEIFGLLSSVDAVGKGTNRKFRVNLNKNRIRSISAYSSNSIFYFPMIVSDQCSFDEITMCARMIEKSNASFVVACISLMPFHRVKADDKAAIEDYLAQFHQNIGMSTGSGQIVGKALNLIDNLEENASTDPDVKMVQDFLYETWQESQRTNTDFVKLVSETVSINDMYNIDPVDPKIRVLQEQFLKNQRELELWGFIGEATEDMFDNYTIEDLLGDEDAVDMDDDDDDELYTIDPSDYPDEAEADILKFMDEGAMKAAKRNSLSDDQFGLPSQRKFPLNDRKHVRLALQMFKHCPEKDRPELARNIRRAADKFNMTIETEGTASKYLTEASSVGEAINSIKFSLEAVSENKILSCKNLTKLRSLESKLKKLKNKYIKYLNRYKKKYKENQKKGSKSKLLIRFNNVTIGNPKAFMQQFGKYIKIINKRLKLVEKRRAELNKRRGTPEATTKISNNGGREVKLEESTLDELGINEALSIVDYCEEQIDRQLDAADEEIFDYEDDDDEFDEDLEDLVISEATTTRSGHMILNPDEVRDYNRAIQNRDDLIRNSRRASDSRARAERTLEGERARHAREIAARDRREENLRSEINNLRNRNDSRQTRAEKAQKEREKLDDKFGVEYDRTRSRGAVDPYRTADAQHVEFRTFDRQIFTDMDMKKANDAIPTFAKATIGFVIDETEDVVSRDILVGIKSYIHRAPSLELINDVYNSIINKRKFLKFVKFITGEERSLSDLLFGIKELRSDALDARGGAGQWRSAFKRRRRWAKMSIPYLMREYTPNGTIVMTMNEVDFIKSEYGIDIMTPDHVKMIMDSDFLLSFVIIDQANEMVYVTYDGQGYSFMQYTYNMLEREASVSNREMREMYRAFTNR